MTSDSLPDYYREFYIGKLTPEGFLTLSLEAARQLNWTVKHASGVRLIVLPSFSPDALPYGEADLRVIGDSGIIRCKSVEGQAPDPETQQKIADDFIRAFKGLQFSYSPKELSRKYQIIKKESRPEEEAAAIDFPHSKKKYNAAIYEVLIPWKKYLITPLLFYLNVALFIVMVSCGVHILMPDPESLALWGGNCRLLTMDGAWWRLLSCLFIHAGIEHLVMNMVALLFIGFVLEPYLGKIRMAAAYLLAGLCASTASLWWHDATVSVGASGAIFGMYSIGLVMIFARFFEKTTRLVMLIVIPVFFGLSLMNSLNSGIDTAAHIGGFLGGFIIGCTFIPGMERSEKTAFKYGRLGILTVGILFLCFFFYAITPDSTVKKEPGTEELNEQEPGTKNNGEYERWSKKFLEQDTQENNDGEYQSWQQNFSEREPGWSDVVKYDQGMKKFAEIESMALEVTYRQEQTPKETLMHEIKFRGIYYWTESIKIIKELDCLSLPDYLHQRNARILHYCDLQVKHYELWYQSLKEATDGYDQKIKSMREEIRQYKQGILRDDAMAEG